MSLPALADEPAIKTLTERASRWFSSLRDRFCAEFETIETQAVGPFSPGVPAPGRFRRKPWERANQDGAPGGGGVMALLRQGLREGRLHVSTVHGTFRPELPRQIPGAEGTRAFCATGISFIAHPWNPNAPTAHMNTRIVMTTRGWFGGGGDLTPVLIAGRSQEDQDALASTPRCAAPASAPARALLMSATRNGAIEYFFLKHRGEPRGIGGIFFD